MKRASTGKPASKGSDELSFSQRLTVAGAQAINAHARVRWLANRLGDELENAAPQEASSELDPADPVVVAVATAATTMKAVTASMAAVSATSVSASMAASFPKLGTGPTPSTKLGVGAPSSKPPPVVKTRLGIGSTGLSKKSGDE